jgi:hypothetical protein
VLLVKADPLSDEELSEDFVADDGAAKGQLPGATIRIRRDESEATGA